LVSGIEFGNKTSKRNWKKQDLQLYWKEDINKINLWHIENI